MYFILVEISNALYFRPIKCYKNNLDKALSELIDLYIIDKRKCIVKVVQDNIDFKRHGIMSDKYRFYQMKEQNYMYSIYKNNKKFLDFEDYPRTSKRLTRLSILNSYNKKKLHNIYKNTYTNNYIIYSRYFTKKSTYVKDLYRFKNIDKHL